MFVKIDCQGAEIPILKGASRLWSSIDFALLEIPLFGEYNDGVPNFCRHVEFMKSIGFVVFDKVDNHYMHGYNIQVDILFVREISPLYQHFQQQRPKLHRCYLQDPPHTATTARTATTATTATRSSDKWTVQGLAWKHVLVNHLQRLHSKVQNTTTPPSVLMVGACLSQCTVYVTHTLQHGELSPQCRTERKTKTTNTCGVPHAHHHFHFNLNSEFAWETLHRYVRTNGLFDFVLCDGTILQTLDYPVIALQSFGKIAKAGYIEFASKYESLQDHSSLTQHHRWLFSLDNETLILYPRDYPASNGPALRQSVLKEAVQRVETESVPTTMSMWWSNGVPFRVVVPSGSEDPDPVQLYAPLRRDAVSQLLVLPTVHPLEYVQKFATIHGDMMFVYFPIHKLQSGLRWMEQNHQFIPFEIVNTDHLGVMGLTIQCIRQTHPHCTSVQEKLLMGPKI